MTSPSSLVHASDQIGSALRDLAPALRSLYEALVKSGFTEAEALTLTSSALSALIARGRALREELE